MEILEWLQILGRGLGVTLQIAIVGIALSTLLSVALAVMSIAPSRLLRIAVTAYIELFRSVPLLALLIFMHFGLGPIVAPLGVPSLWIVITGIVLSESAYLGAVYRSTVQAVPESQWEASRSLGMGWWRSAWHVVLPQSVVPAIPSTVNAAIATLKDSSLASLVAISELTLMATSIVSVTFRPMEIYLLLACVYLALILPLAVLGEWLEKRLAPLSVGSPRFETVHVLGPTAAEPRREPPDDDISDSGLRRVGTTR